MSFSNPRENILHAALREGMKVADLGAGSGHYTQAAASMVGSEGRVYAVDVQEDILKHLKDAAERKHLYNIEYIWGDLERAASTNLRDHAIDVIILSNTLFQIENRFALLAEIKRIIKPGGKLLVIDWAGSYGGMGPTPEKVVSEHDAEAFFIDGGFHKTKSFRAGPHHYGILFTSPS